jgi:cytochrome c-type biogenesis protein CcmF
VILVGWEPIASQGATFKVYLNPLINFVWMGGFVFIFGTIVAAWPDPDPEVVRRRVKAGRRALART